MLTAQNLAEVDCSNGWKMFQVRIMERASWMCWILARDGEHHTPGLSGPVGGGEGEAIVSATIQWVELV